MGSADSLPDRGGKECDLLSAEGARSFELIFRFLNVDKKMPLKLNMP